MIKPETDTSNQAQVPFTVLHFCNILLAVLTFTSTSHIHITYNHISYTCLSAYACARARACVCVLVILQNTGLCLYFVKRMAKLINLSCGFLMEKCETNQLLCQPQIKCKFKDLPTSHRTTVTVLHERKDLVTFMHGNKCPSTIC